MNNENREEKKEKKQVGLTTKILFGLLFGAITGFVLNYAVPDSYFKNTIVINGILQLIGQGFIRLMQMLVVPLVLCSLVCGSMAIGDTKKLGNVGVKALGFYICTTALAVTVALTTANVINPGIGLDMSKIHKSSTVATESATQSTNIVDTFLNIIPSNIFHSLSEGTMLQVILFALILGVILAKMGDRVETVKNFFSQFNDIMMEMTMIVMKVAPIGVFCLIAKTFSQLGIEAFQPLLKYMIAVLIALGVQCFIVYQALLKVFTGLNPFLFIKKFFPVMEFAFSTATSNATFTIPLGATINMDGTSIMQGVAVVFAAQAFNIHLDLTDYLMVIGAATLASIGTAGIPSVGLVTLTMVFNTVNLPVEAIGLIMGIDRILDMTRTAVNITGDAVCTTIVAKQNDALDRDIFYQGEQKEAS